MIQSAGELHLRQRPKYGNWRSWAWADSKGTSYSLL